MAVDVETLVASLNPEQRLAAEHHTGPALVLAGAGSGKTRVLTTRLALLVAEYGVPAYQILAMTFTNKAAHEMRERVKRVLDVEELDSWVGTFHSFGAWVLRRHAERLGWGRNFTILDSDQSEKEVKKIMQELDFPIEKFKPRKVAGLISDLKNALRTPEEFYTEAMAGRSDFEQVAATVYPLYEESLKRQNCFDFDDLILRPIELFMEDPLTLESYRKRFQFVMVDEYQDTNRAQYRLIELLAGEHQNLLVVGDDDQSIYGWRGADIHNILEFEQGFPGSFVVRLERNYRSCGKILGAANSVIARNQQRLGKTLRAVKEEGEPVRVIQANTDLEEARWVCEDIESRVGRGDSYQNYAILYRTNAQSRLFEETLRRYRIPYQLVGGLSFYQRREIQDVVAYLRLLANPYEEGAFERVVNLPKRGIGGKGKAALLEWARANDLSPIHACQNAEQIKGLSKKATQEAIDFADLIKRLTDRAASAPAGEIVEALVEELSFIEMLEAEGKEGQDRADNVRELLASAAAFDPELAGEEIIEGTTPLEAFLQRVALVSTADRHEDDQDVVTLMTMHAAKGLEFPNVYIGGVENELFPHPRSMGSTKEMEEERRLFYVGMTRAEERLVLLYSLRRRIGARYTYTGASMFIEELPDACIDKDYA